MKEAGEWKVIEAKLKMMQRWKRWAEKENLWRFCFKSVMQCVSSLPLVEKKCPYCRLATGEAELLLWKQLRRCCWIFYLTGKCAAVLIGNWVCSNGLWCHLQNLLKTDGQKERGKRWIRRSNDGESVLQAIMSHISPPSHGAEATFILMVELFASWQTPKAARRRVNTAPLAIKRRLCSLCLYSLRFYHHPRVHFHEFAFGWSIHCVCFDLDPMLPILICHCPCFVLFLILFSPSLFSPNQIPPPPSPSPPFAAYLDDEEDEDPFGDYVISKSHLIVSSPLLGPQWTRLPQCDCVLCAFVLESPPFLSVGWCFRAKRRSVAHNVTASNWAPAGNAERQCESAWRRDGGITVIAVVPTSSLSAALNVFPRSVDRSWQSIRSGSVWKCGTVKQSVSVH